MKNHKAKLDGNVSYFCCTCKVRKMHIISSLSVNSVNTQRKTLEDTVEDILIRESLNSVSGINLKVLNGMEDDISKQGQND